MDAERRAAIEKKIAKIRESYIQTLPAEFEALELQLSKLTPNEPARDIISEIHKGLHRITGAGGNVGLHQLSIESRKIEQDLMHWLKSEETYFPAAHCQALPARIESLKDVLDREK